MRTSKLKMATVGVVNRCCFNGLAALGPVLQGIIAREYVPLSRDDRPFGTGRVDLDDVVIVVVAGRW